MLELDISQMQQYGETFFTSSDIGYLVFMIIGIVSYTTIPSMANLVVNAGGGSAITSKMTYMAQRAVGMSTGVATMGAGAVMGATGMVADVFGDANLIMSKGASTHGTDSGYFRDKLSGND